MIIREKFQIQRVGTFNAAFSVVYICHPQHFCSRTKIPKQQIGIFNREIFISNVTHTSEWEFYSQA